MLNPCISQRPPCHPPASPLAVHPQKPFVFADPSGWTQQRRHQRLASPFPVQPAALPLLEAIGRSNTVFISPAAVAAVGENSVSLTWAANTNQHQVPQEQHQCSPWVPKGLQPPASSHSLGQHSGLCYLTPLAPGYPQGAQAAKSRKGWAA